MEFVLQWYELMILTSAAVTFGFMVACILAAASRSDHEAEIYANGLIDRDVELKKMDRTIYNQRLKIVEQAETICNLKDSVTYYQSIYGEVNNG